MTRRIRARVCRAGAFACALAAVPLLAQTPVGAAFTYQGRLAENGSPANGVYDLRFILFNADAGGSQVGPILTLQDVTVANGLFAVSLDFGASAFAGEARWLEVGARPGASTGAFTILSPRQELAPSPHAVFSQKTPWTGISGVPAGFADGVDNDSGGTVQTVSTGAGLAGGPITTAGTVAVATGGISSSMIANGAVGSAQINAAEVQARVSSTCPVGHYLRGINSDGTVVCEAALMPPVIATVVDGPGGADCSIAVGTDGLPVISYWAGGAQALKVAHCGNAACTAGNAITTVDDSSANVGLFTSIAIGADGLPVISYWDQANLALKVAHCGNATCTAGNTTTTVDAGSAVGQYTSIAIGTDGLPVISYYDGTALALKVAHCGSVDCAGGNAVSTVEDQPTNRVGLFTSIAVGSDGLPVISYLDDTVYVLKVAHCGNATCTAGNTITIVDDPANLVGAYTSVAVGTDGFPVISYYDGSARALKVAHCGNAACTAGNTITTVDDPANDVGSFTSIAIGSDGLPVISHYDYTAGTLKVAHCGNAACSAGNTLATADDPTNQVGRFASVAIGADGLPVISYQDVTAGTLRVAKCGNRTCQ